MPYTPDDGADPVALCAAADKADVQIEACQPVPEGSGRRISKQSSPFYDSSGESSPDRMYLNANQIVFVGAGRSRLEGGPVNQGGEALTKYVIGSHNVGVICR